MSLNSKGVCFSSNYLELYNSDISIFDSYAVPILVSDELAPDDDVTFKLNIANVSKRAPLTPNKNNIEYALDIRVNAKAGESYSGKFKVNSREYTDSFTLDNNMLNGGIVDRNNCSISMKYSDIDKVEMVIKAIPTVDTQDAVNGKILARKFTFFAYKDNGDDSSGWTASIVEKSNSIDSSALNYELSGYGEGNITINWNSDKFEIDPFFVEDIEGETLSENSITFPVDSATKDFYQIIFF